MDYVQENFVTSDFIQNFSHIIRSAPMIMVDANLHPKSLEAASKSMLHLSLHSFLPCDLRAIYTVVFFLFLFSLVLWKGALCYRARFSKV